MNKGVHGFLLPESLNGLFKKEKSWVKIEDRGEKALFLVFFPTIE